MVKEYSIGGIHFRTFLDGNWFYVKWSRTGHGDWERWPGYFMASQKTTTVLKSIVRYINGKYIARV